jgi:hypothetical protein
VPRVLQLLMAGFVGNLASHDGYALRRLSEADSCVGLGQLVQPGQLWLVFDSVGGGCPDFALKYREAC